MSAHRRPVLVHRRPRHTPQPPPPPLLPLLLLLCAARGAWAADSGDDALFTPGTQPADRDGVPVRAHEGWLLRIEDQFFWYGSGAKALTNASAPGGGADWLSGSVNLYTSYDLTSWKRRGAVFTAAGLPPALRGGVGDAPVRLERPKVLYNAARRFYVLIFHLDGLANDRGLVGWAISPSAAGPFSFQGADQPDGLPAWDLSVAAGEGSDAWLVRNVPGAGLAISRLAGDFLGTSGGVCSRIPRAWTGGADPGAPCLFAWRGRWYLLASQRRGWAPSAPRMWVSNGSDPCAGWAPVRWPAGGAGGGRLYDSSPAFVFPYAFAGGDADPLLIYFGDRWQPDVGNASYVWAAMLPGADGAPRLVDPGTGWRPSDFRPPPSLAAT
ncbi:hypothetical protein HT031_004426 [Scenedesmus sp. PABB004]|nr:hypothetical protein HT031_004426 [Scenedesmus sp. PABB004]